MALVSGVVDLSDMKLERVPAADLVAMARTEELNYSLTHRTNRCKSHDASSSPLPLVRCLILKNNRLVYLPSSLFARGVQSDTPGLEDEDEGLLRGLRVLDVANNRLASVPSTIGQLASLTVLNLTSNRLTSLPPEIGSRTRTCTRTSTRTRLIAVCAGRLANLRDLYVGGNELTGLPDQIGACHGLRRLYLTSNPLRSLPLGLGETRLSCLLHSAPA
jgi:leucine-rich repeat protein SHOC2